jgi:DNA-binding PadR family transcriptional regulator
MTPISFHILLALAAGDARAPELLIHTSQDLAATLLVAERSFYAALPRLEREGCIEAHGEGRAKRYHLTALGRRRLQAEKIRLGRAVTLLHERL